MIDVDIRTLYLVTAIAAVFMAGAMTMLWRTVPDERACRYWAQGSVLFAAGFLMIALRGTIPSLLSSAVANTAVIGGYGLTVLGVSAFTHGRLFYGPVVAAAALIFLASCYFLYIEPDVGFRIFMVAIVGAAMAFWGVVRLATTITPGMRLTQGVAAVVFALNGTMFVLRAATAWFRPDPEFDLLAATNTQVVFSLTTIFCMIAATFCFAAMVVRRLHIHLDHLACHDPLTGLLNRNAMEASAVRETARARRHRYPLALLMMDLDRFKGVNDTFGHEAGDTVLRGFAGTAAANIRRDDVLGRFGGEEFLVLLPDSDHQQALQIAERIRAAVADTPANHEGTMIGVTVSIGVAVLEGDTTWEATLRAADAALYTAKGGGRNRVAG